LKNIFPKIIGAQINAISMWSKKVAAKKAFLVFCTPRNGRIKPHQHEALNPAKDQRIEIEENLTIQTYRSKVIM